MTRFSKTNIILSVFLFFLSVNIYSETITDSDLKFGLDIPEGYELVDYSSDGFSYILEHPNIPVTLVLKITNQNDSDTSSASSSSSRILKETLSKLSATGDFDSFYWNDQLCSISLFSMSLDKKYSGWSVTAPTVMKDYYVTLLCYAPAEKESACEQFIMSTINSLYLSSETINTPGIITTYAFPQGKTKNIDINAGNKRIRTTIKNQDIEASQFVIDMEYSVLSLYGNHKSWKEAWQRFYRMIYRDSFSRLENVAIDLYDNLYRNSDIEYAQTLLTWVQDFNYQRAEKKTDSDFTCLPAVICGEGSDCDSRSMLMCLLLKAAGIESVLYFSPEYSHALVAAEINAPGQTFELEGTGRSFLIGETTAKVTWGKIAQDQSDRTKWIPVILP